MKETFYFPHDYNAFNDEKIVRLRRKYGLEGYGIYWALCERLVNSSEGRLLLSDLEDIAFDMRVECERIADAVHSFELFKTDGTYFWSNRLLEFFKKKEEKSAKAKSAAKIRWADEPVNNADAMQTHSDSNADAIQRKERKGKERKEIKTLSNDNGAEPIQHGNVDINKILEAIRLKCGIDDFSDSQKWKRIYGQHCSSLLKKIGSAEFSRRLDIILHDSFKQKRCNEIRYVYEQVKGFIEPNEKSIKSF